MYQIETFINSTEKLTHTKLVVLPKVVQPSWEPLELTWATCSVTFPDLCNEEVKGRIGLKELFKKPGYRQYH